MLRIKLFFLSSMIILCLTGFQYWLNLEEQIKLPSEDWSRSFPITIEPSNYAKLQSVTEEDGYTISLLDFKKLIVLSCDKDLNCEENRVSDQLNTYKNTWSDKKNSYFLREDVLIHTTNSDEEIVIDQNVVDFSKTKDRLVYWTGNQEVIISDSKSTEDIRRFEMNEPVSFVKIIENQIFVITENKKESHYTVYNLSNELSKLFEFNVESHKILSTMDIIQHTNSQYSLLLETDVLAGGSHNKNVELAQFQLSGEQAPIFTDIHFVENDTGAVLKDIYFTNVFQSKQGPMITFSAKVVDSTGERVAKIFVGEIKEDKIYANAVTKKGEHYSRPLLINDQTAIYFKSDGPKRELQYSSTDIEKMQESNGIMEGDYTAAFYLFATKLFNGFLLVLFSIAWNVPSLIFAYIILFIMRKIKNTIAYQTAIIAFIVSLFTMQLFLLPVEKLTQAIPYLTQNWHFTIMLLFASILSILPLLLLRYKVSEFNFLIVILYMATMNLAILFLLVGPYII